MGQSGYNTVYQRKYYLKYKAKITARDRAKRIKRRESILCRICSIPCRDFGYRYYCGRTCQKADEKRQQREWKRINASTGWFRQYKQKLGKCALCGYNKCLAALDFHHKKGTTKLKSPSSVKNCCKKVGMKELSKCVLICANCHREQTWLIKTNQRGDVWL